MRNVLSVFIMMLSVHVCLIGQNVPQTEAVLRFLGVEDPQDLDPDEVDRLEHMMEDPVRINMMDSQALRSTGLFSAYQIAVVEDYISRHGQIHSLTELSLLDGFGEDFTTRVAPFITLDTYPKANAGIRHEAAVRSGLKCHEADGADGSYGAKYRIDINETINAAFALSRSAGTGSWAPSALSGSLSWKCRKRPIRVIAGDFNARFGQGLVLWNNTFINSLTTPDSFMKRPTGLSQPWSFTGSNALCGLAADISLGQFHLSAMTAYGNLQLMPALNLAWYGRNGQVSVTSLLDKAGVDAAFCVRGINIFGEVCYDWNKSLPKALLGTRFKAAEYMDIAVQVRAFTSEEYAAAAGGQLHLGQRVSAVFSTDVTYYPIAKVKEDPYSVQVKSQLSCELILAAGWKLKLRFSERFRTWGHPWRSDLRADLIYNLQPFVLTTRINLLNCDRTGFLSYVEGCYIREILSIYLRQGVFFIDDWDDRIYVYERDAPGSFNVPAMYGRGLLTGMTASYKCTRSLRLYARVSYLGYPFMEKKKPGKAELKLQVQYRF